MQSNKNRNNKLKKFDYTTPKTEEDFIKIENHYNSLDEWVKALGFYRTSSNRVEALSHTGLDGKIYSIPITEEKTLHRLLNRDMNYPKYQDSQMQFYICEFLTYIHAWFCDFDILSDKKMGDKEWHKLANILYRKMRECFPDEDQNLQMVWCLTKEAVSATENKEQVFKYGVHIVWPNVIVKYETTQVLYNILLADINRYMTPRPQPPSNSWSDRFDKNVYGSNNINTGGLRLPGCTKMGKCPMCKGKKRKTTGNLNDIIDKTANSGGSITTTSAAISNKSRLNLKLNAYTDTTNNYDPIDCKLCLKNKGKFSTGRKYSPQFVFDTQGKFDQEALDTLKCSYLKTLELCHLRRNQTLCSESRFVLPKLYPPILNDDNYDEEDDEERYKQKYKQQLQQFKLNHRTITTTINNKSNNLDLGSNFGLGLNINGNNNDDMDETDDHCQNKNKNNNKNKDQDHQDNENDNNSQNDDDDDDDDNDQSGLLDINEVSKPKKIPPSLAHLQNIFDFPETKDTILEMKNKYRWRQKNQRINNLIQGMIRDYNSNFKDVNVIDVRANNPKVKENKTHWIIYVDGIGSNWCLNKGGRHNSAHIYFKIMDGKIFHRCTSKKNIKRQIGGCECRDYSSCSKPVDDVVMKALTWETQKHPNFVSVDEELMFGKYENMKNQYYNNRDYIEKTLKLDTHKEFEREYEEQINRERDNISKDNEDINNREDQQNSIPVRMRQFSAKKEKKIDQLAELCEEYVYQNYQKCKFDREGNPLEYGMNGVMNFNYDEKEERTREGKREGMSLSDKYQSYEADQTELIESEKYMKLLYLISFECARDLKELPEEIIASEEDDIHKIQMVELKSSISSFQNSNSNGDGDSGINQDNSKPKRKYVRKNTSNNNNNSNSDKNKNKTKTK
jgi:hypothetical protein